MYITTYKVQGNSTFNVKKNFFKAYRHNNKTLTNVANISMET